MSKLLGLLMVVVLLTALAVPVLAQGAFEDVEPGHWAYNAIDTLARAGLVEGYPDGTFRGQQAMTRYEMAMVIARLMNSKALQGTPGPQGPPGPAGGGVGLTPEQQALLTKLQQEFAPELQRLRTDLNELEARVRDLEARPTVKPKITISGDMSLRAGLYGTDLNVGASSSTGYPYPGIGGDAADQQWFAPAEWGGVNIPIPDVDSPGDWDFTDGLSIPISDSLKDSFKAPDFMTMRTRIIFAGDLGSDVAVKAVLLADTRGNALHPAVDSDDYNYESTSFAGYTTPGGYYSDGLMDTVRIDEAWMKYGFSFVRPISVTAGKLYWGFGQGLLVNNSQFPTKSGRVEVSLTGDAPGEGITYTAILGALDREAFSAGETALGAGYPNDPEGSAYNSTVGGQDDYFVQNLTIPIGSDWRIGGTLLGTGYGSERGWSADLKGSIFGLDLWGEYARLTRFPDGSDQTGADFFGGDPVDLSEEDTAWIAGLGWHNDDISISGQYGEVEPLYALAGFGDNGVGDLIGKGWDPVGLGAIVNALDPPFDSEDLIPMGYLNLPLSLLHPVEEFNPHYVNWLDRPLFLDATNVAKGWEVAVNFRRLLGDRTGLSARYYDGKAYREEFLGWLFTDGGATMDKPDRWRDADPVWMVTLTHHFTDTMTANLTYGQRAVDNVMSPNNGPTSIQDDPIKVLRLDLSVAF